MSNTDPKTSRREILKGTTVLAAGAVGAAVLSLAPTVARAATEVDSSAQRKCATCRYWGGVRRISENGKTVSAENAGWCNNPNSPAYQKQTKPTQGAPVWIKWEALD